MGETDRSSVKFHVLYQSVVVFIQRQYPVIVFIAAISIATGLIYVFTATPSYTASAAMIIDANKAQLFQQQSLSNDIPMDASAVESQVEILKSENIALAVIKQLHLTEDPEFVGAGGGLIGTLFNVLTGSFSSSGPTSEFALTRSAVGAFESRLTVQRVGLTYVILISFRSFSPDRAAEIANAVADAYVDDQLEAKYQAARRAGTWLQTRLGELREQASTAELAVVKYKNQNNMIDAGGRTINEQQLAEINSQLIVARTETETARARFDRVKEVLSSNSPDATVTATVADSLKNDVIQKLRSQYLDLSRREEDWTARYGPDHLAVVNVRNQMREIQNAIRNELQQIAQTYESDLAIAKQRQDNAQKQLDQTVAQSQVANQAQVALRELESNAQSYQALSDNFLQRYMESVQQQSFPITDSRVISVATRPFGKSSPKTTLVLSLATMFGLVMGALVGGWREFSDRVFRTRDQIETALQTDCIALVPALIVDDPDVSGGGAERLFRGWMAKIAPRTRVGGRSDKVNQSLRQIALEVDRKIKVGGSVREPSNVKSLPSSSAVPQIIVSPPGVFSAIMDAPLSAFTEAIRSIKVAIDLSAATTKGKIIGLTSTVPSEGKSSVASAVSRLAAATGARTLLVDCDLRNPTLSRILSPNAACGLLEVLKGQSTLEDTIWVDQATNMTFLPVALPVALQRRLVHSSEILASEHTRKFFDSLRNSYDYIFVDFPPLMPIVDVRASTKLVDSYLFVVEWGRTRSDYVEQALSSARGVYEHLLGVVLNKVDLMSLGRYDGRGTGYYHHGNYHRYGYTE